jgi:hypothetical protein
MAEAIVLDWYTCAYLRTKILAPALKMLKAGVMREGRWSHWRAQISSRYSSFTLMYIVEAIRVMFIYLGIFLLQEFYHLG